MTPAVDELAVPCPRCPAGKGEACETPSGEEAKRPHTARVKAAERARQAADRRALEELATDRINEPRWQRVYLNARSELEQRGAWTRLAAEQLEALVRNMAQADKARTAAEGKPTLEGSTGQTVANPLYAIAVKLDGQALSLAIQLKLTPATRGTSATVDDGVDEAADKAPTETDELAVLDLTAERKRRRR